jgi:Carbohydrate family 9 binding domain-like
MLRRPFPSSHRVLKAVLPATILAGAAVLLTSAAPPGDAPRRRGSSVDAPVLQWIQIDGDLSDWPAAMPRYAIKKQLIQPSLGTGGLEGTDLSTSPDLSACFMVGYDPKKQVVYVAVIVRDDELVAGNSSHLDTDAMEIYVDGLHSDRAIPLQSAAEWNKKFKAEDTPVQQYVGIPGKGVVYGGQNTGNPALMDGDVRKTRTRMAWRRRGDVTTYEWAIQVFDHYPDRPTRLEPCKRIGFEVAVLDKDVPVSPQAAVFPKVSTQPLEEPAEDRVAYIHWGPTWTGIKKLDAGSLGEIVLGK